MTTDLKYDARGNLITKIENNITTATAEYPASCDALNRKYCNQAIWISDAKGNKTEYTYHPESGQVATITYPANKRGIRAQTRYTYAQKSANYFVAPLSKTQSASPIWLKVSESYCTDGPVSSNGDCALNDEVVTNFEYEHDNLLMTGMTVTSQKDNKTLRTCYGYDIYGNRISETQPSANLTSCH